MIKIILTLILCFVAWLSFMVHFNGRTDFVITREFAIQCIDGVEYIRWENAAAAKFGKDGKIVTCIRKTWSGF